MKKNLIIVIIIIVVIVIGVMISRRSSAPAPTPTPSPTPTANDTTGNINDLLQTTDVNNLDTEFQQIENDLQRL